jgi:hypothetical protein
MDIRDWYLAFLLSAPMWAESLIELICQLFGW